MIPHFFENNIFLTELSSSLPDNSSPLQKLDEIKKLYNKWVEDFAKPVIAVSKNEALSKNSSSPNQQDILKEEEIVNKKLQREFSELLNAEYENRAKRRVLLEKSEQKIKNISILLTAFSIVVGFVIAILLARHILKRILKMVRISNGISKGDYKVQVEDNSNTATMN